MNRPAPALRLGFIICTTAVIGCSGGGSHSGGSPPGTPTEVIAIPGNGQAVLSWRGSTDATSYNVYWSDSEPVTTSGTRVSAASISSTISGLTNGKPYFFAVASVNGSGESPLSAESCAVPTTANTSGLSLYDGLCGSRGDGQKWVHPNVPGGATFSRSGVQDGAAVFSVDVANQEARSMRGVSYGSFAVVNSTAKRVSTLQADVVIPASGATRDGSSEIRAAVSLVYSPPQDRMSFPGARLDALVAEVGLIDVGTGLYAFRGVTHCDEPSCASLTSIGVAFTDPPTFGAIGNGPDLQRGAPAAYDTSYTVSVSLDESTGVFRWSVSGGAFGSGVSGTADPSAYVGSAIGWHGIALAGAGFETAELGVSTLDLSAAGGGSGRVTGQFRQVLVGFDGGAAALFDDFSGTGGNSGPTELSLASWSNGGARSVTLDGGSLLLHGQQTSAGTAISVGQGLYLSQPEAWSTVQADLSILSAATTGPSGNPPANANAFVQGRYYSDGTLGTGSTDATGDVLAGVFLTGLQSQPTATYLVARCADPGCSTIGSPITGNLSVADLDGGIHTLRVSWDAGTHDFTFGVDATNVSVDPTGTLPFSGRAHAPMRRILGSTTPGGTPGVTISEDIRVNNVFVAP